MKNRLSVVLISAGSIMLLTAIVLMVLVATDIIDDTRTGQSDLDTVTVFGEPIKSPTPGPTPTPTNEFPPGSTAPIERLVIPSAEIDAPVVVKGIDENDVMESPDNAYDTVWYDFSGHPGSDGNAVFSGHVDYIRVGKAVFWNLKDLEPGDIIEVRLTDGNVYKYAVNFKQQYDAATAPVEEIVGKTDKQTVTLITCSGTFNSGTSQYDKRLVVRAERIRDSAPQLPGPAT
jgi:LPXTG-site transpeptidase (sortase) family protein